jgi:L-iditol 2-dehydrogenase
MSSSLTALPTTMKVAELRDVDDLQIIDYPVPHIGPGELLVKIAASGICSGDLMPWYIRRKAPLVLGHEPTGEIVAIGDGLPAVDRNGRAFALGDRIAIHHHAPCLKGRACGRGAYVQCATWKASKIHPGGIAEYVRVPNENLVDVQHLPETVGWDEAVLVEPLGCVMKSLRRARLRRGDLVYVIGLGVMGLLHVAVLRSRGYDVIASDFHAARRAKGLHVGATACVIPDEVANACAALGLVAPDVVICGPGTATALSHAAETVGPDGTVVMFTPLAPNERWIMDQSALYFRDITLTASYSCGPDDTAEALEWLKTNPLLAEDFGIVRFPLKDTAKAYQQMVQAEIIKAIITF